MNWIKVCLALTAMLAMGFEAHAGKLQPSPEPMGCGAEKACGCTSDCVPASCKPSIKKPCHRNVHSYQRGCAPAKPALVAQAVHQAAVVHLLHVPPIRVAKHHVQKNQPVQRTRC